MMRGYLQELINEFEKTHQNALRLAEVVSIAVRVEPELLRLARLTLVPEANAGDEADLWFSPLVKVRNIQGFVFYPEVAQILRMRLAGRKDLLDAVWDKLFIEVHKDISPALLLEEEITWLALKNPKDPKIENLLQRTLATLVQDDDLNGVSHWFLRAISNLPSSIQDLDIFKTLELGANLRVGVDDSFFIKNRTKLTEILPYWGSFLSSNLIADSIGVRFVEDGIEFGDIDSLKGAEELKLPPTNPLLIDVSWREKSGKKLNELILLRQHENKFLSLDVDEIELNTLSGEKYKLYKRVLKDPSISSSTHQQELYLIREAYENNLKLLNLSNNELTHLPLEITKICNLTELNLFSNLLISLPPEIRELKNLTTLDLSNNQLIQIPPEIGELRNLKELFLSNNHLTELPPEIGKLKNLTKLYINKNQLTQLPSEIGELRNLKELFLSNNHLTELPPESGKLKNLTKLYINKNQLTQLPSEIGELRNLKELFLSNNHLTELPPESGKLKNLTKLYINKNQLTQLPSEIEGLKSLTTLDLSNNQLAQIPPEIGELKNLTTLDIYNNPLTSPPPEIVSMGIEAIFTYLKQTKTTEDNEAKLILIGNEGVGKTCLAHRLVNDLFLRDSVVTEGINIYKWKIAAPDSENSEIMLNIWDFGAREVYHATHQFFMTTRSIYLLVWNARRKKDYDSIYYWLHTIEAFGENSPIILVMSKMNEIDDDLNLNELKSQFSQISGYIKIDCSDGRGISALKECIRETAWNLPLMRVRWVNSWYNVREKLERLKRDWITYDEFCKICVSEGVDDGSIDTLDGFLHDLGVTLHFRDKVGLENIVILKPEWAINAFYKILSKESVLHREGILLHSELGQIWEKKVYPPNIHSQLMDLMNKFELSYELSDKGSYLIPELLPKTAHNFLWDENENLYFYYLYDYFLPPSIITSFIVRMHQVIETKENGMPLCWREGAVLNLQNSRALVKMKPDEKQIEIRITGDNKRGALGAICDQLDQINASIKKINVSKQIPCNCSENCPERYSYEKLLKAEMKREETIQCHESYEHISISSLLDGYKRREEALKEYNEFSGLPEQTLVFSPKFMANLEANQVIKAEQKINVNINVNIDLKIDLPQIQNEFNKLKKEIKNLNPELGSELDEIQDSLDEVSANSETEKLNKPLNKVRRILEELNDPDSNYNKVIKGTQKGIEYAQKLGRTYNKFAQWLAMPKVPDPLL